MPKETSLEKKKRLAKQAYDDMKRVRGANRRTKAADPGVGKMAPKERPSLLKRAAKKK